MSHIKRSLGALASGFKAGDFYVDPLSMQDSVIVERTRTKRKQAKVGRLHYALLVVFGLSFAAYGFTVYQTTTPDNGDIIVEGTVIRVIGFGGNPKTTKLRPTVQYVDPSTGGLFEATADSPASMNYRVGDTASVAYKPGSPQKGRVLGESRYPLIAIGLMIFAPLCILQGLRGVIMGPGSSRR